MRGRRPLVSVLVPTFNHGRYIRQALQGIVQQACDFPFEVLVGDDASSDETLAIAMAFADRHPELVKVSALARNVGGHANFEGLVSLARGEFIAYCDGDDYWNTRDKLQRQVDHLRAHPGVGAVHADFDRIVPAASGWKRLAGSNGALGRRIPAGDVFGALLKENFIQACTLCVRTELVRRYLGAGLPVAGYPVGDWPLCIYVARYSEIHYIGESMAVYRKVRDSAIHSGHASRLRIALGCRSMVGSLCDHFDVDPATRFEAMRTLQRGILSFAVLARDRAAFAEAWHWLAAHDPEALTGRHRWLPLIVRSAFACGVLASVAEARQAWAVLRGYRAMDARSLANFEGTS